MIKLLPLLMFVLSISISKTHKKTPAQWSQLKILWPWGLVATPLIMIINPWNLFKRQEPQIKSITHSIDQKTKTDMKPVENINNHHENPMTHYNNPPSAIVQFFIDRLSGHETAHINYENNHGNWFQDERKLLDLLKDIHNILKLARNLSYKGYSIQIKNHGLTIKFKKNIDELDHHNDFLHNPQEYFMDQSANKDFFLMKKQRNIHKSLEDTDSWLMVANGIHKWAHFYHMELSYMASLVDFIMVIFKKYQPWTDTSLLGLEINGPGFNGVQHLHIHIKKYKI